MCVKGESYEVQGLGNIMFYSFNRTTAGKTQTYECRNRVMFKNKDGKRVKTNTLTLYSQFDGTSCINVCKVKES